MKTLSLKEAFNQIVLNNIKSKHELSEYKAVKFQDKAHNDNFPKCYDIKTCTLKNSSSEDIELLLDAGFVDNVSKMPISVNTEYGEFQIEGRSLFHKKFGSYYHEFSTDVAVGGAIKRKQKKYPNGLYLTRDMLKESTSLKEFKEVNNNNMLLLTQMEIAKFLVQLSETDYVQDDLLDAVLLEEEYRKISDKKEQIGFLKANNFVGLENFNYEYKSSDDGYGHKNVSSMILDFLNRSCYIAHGNSGD